MEVAFGIELAEKQVLPALGGVDIRLSPRIEIAVIAGETAAHVHVLHPVHANASHRLFAALAAPGPDPFEAAGGVKLAEKNIYLDAAVLGRVSKPGLAPGRIKIDLPAGIHAGHVHVTLAVNRHPGPVIITFAAPGARPLKGAVKIELAQEDVKENQARCGHVVGVPIVAAPGIEINPVAREIPGDIQAVAGHRHVIALGAEGRLAGHYLRAPGTDPLERAVRRKLAEKNIIFIDLAAGRIGSLDGGLHWIGVKVNGAPEGADHIGISKPVHIHPVGGIPLVAAPGPGPEQLSFGIELAQEGIDGAGFRGAPIKRGRIRVEIHRSGEVPGHVEVPLLIGGHFVDLRLVFGRTAAPGPYPVGNQGIGAGIPDLIRDPRNRTVF